MTKGVTQLTYWYHASMIFGPRLVPQRGVLSGVKVCIARPTKKESKNP